MAPQFLHPRMASILFFLTTSFALPPAMQVLAQEQADTIKKIQSPDDLDPETRRRYDEARDKLREADRLLASAMDEIEREVPALALARQRRDKARDIYLSELAAVELEYKQRSKEADGHFERWRNCSMAWMGHAQLEKMLNDSDKRPIAVWGLRAYLAKDAKSDDAESLLPTNLEAMSDEQLLRAYDMYLQKKFRGSPLEDCQELERAAAPSAKARESMEKFARAFMECGTCALYVTHHKLDPRIQAAKKRRQQAYKDVCAVWQDWAVHEPCVRATNRAL